MAWNCNTFLNLCSKLINSDGILWWNTCYVEICILLHRFVNAVYTHNLVTDPKEHQVEEICTSRSASANWSYWWSILRIRQYPYFKWSASNTIEILDAHPLWHHRRWAKKFHLLFLFLVRIVLFLPFICWVYLLKLYHFISIICTYYTCHGNKCFNPKHQNRCVAFVLCVNSVCASCNTQCMYTRLIRNYLA